MYHNALSSGVEIEDILKYARKTKQKDSTEAEVIQELKQQVAEHEKTIMQLIQQGLKRPSDAPRKSSVSSASEQGFNERSSLSYGGMSGGKGYGSIASNDGIVSIVVFIQVVLLVTYIWSFNR